MEKLRENIFKFTKIAFAVLAAGGTLGFVVPKLNQAITRKMIKQEKNNQENAVKPTSQKAQIIPMKKSNIKT